MKDTILARRLRNLREEKGYKQEGVANKLGIKSNTLSGYETGTRSPDPDMIVKLSQLYNVTTDYLLGESDSRHLTAVDEEEIDREIREVTSKIKIWYKDEPKDKEVKLRLLNKVIDSFEEDE